MLIQKSKTTHTHITNQPHQHTIQSSYLSMARYFNSVGNIKVSLRQNIRFVSREIIFLFFFFSIINYLVEFS